MLLRALPDTDDEYDAMEDVRTRVDASLARDLQAEFDAEAAGLSSSTARPSSRPGITIGRSARPSSAPRQPTAAPPAAPPARSKRRKSDRAPLSADPIPEDHVVPGFRYPPQGGIRPRYPVTTPVVDTPLLTNLHNHPSSSVRRCQDPPESIGRGGWSEFSQLLDIARPEYRDFLVELGFGPFLSIRYVHVRHPLVRCWVERFFHHTGTIHLSTCEVGVLPVDWSAILGIRFGGRIPPSDPVSDFEALEILGIDDPAAIVGKKLFYLKISYLKDLLVREIEEPPTELRYRQWTAYFIFSCFLGNDKSSIPTPIVGMFRDIDDLRDYDWGALTYGFYIRGLRRFSRRETASFLGFWQFTLFWAFEHFAVFAPSRLPAAPDSAFPLARRWDSAWIQRLTTRTLMECRTTVDCIRDVDIVFQPYSTFLLERPEVFRAMELSRLRIWIRSPRSWELLMGERTLRQLGGDALVPVDPPQLMTIEDYIPRAPSDSFVAGVEAYPALILADVPYREWFEQVSLGSLMSLHEVEGGRVMGGSAMDSHLSRSSGEFEWLQTEILRLQLELSVSEDRYAADMARAQEETARVQAELTQVQGELTRTQGDLTQSRRDLGSRDAVLTAPCGDHSETRGSASWHGHYSCYWSWLVWSWVSGRSSVVGPKSFDYRIAQDFLIGDFLQNDLHTARNGPLGVSEKGQIRVSLGSMASSSNDPDSLVTLHFHDFRVERMRHWWTLLGEDDHADIVGFFGKFPPFMRLQVDRGLLEALASFWDPTHCCFSIGEVDLVPTMEEYAELLQLDRPFSETPIARPEETWRKANISLDLLTKYFSRSDFPVKLARDFIAGKKGWKKFRINAFKIAFAGIFLFPTSAGRIDLGVIPIVFSEGRSIIPAILCETVRSLSYCRRQGEGVPMFCTQLLQLWFCSHLRHFYRLQTPYHFERHTVSQTVNIALPFTGNSRDWASYLLDLPLGEWSWKVTWGPAVWKPWTHCALFDGVPLPGVWGCTGYYPSLALRQFGGVQYPPRLGDLDAVTFDYIPSEDMWRLLSRVEVIWEGRLSEVVPHRGWPTVRPGTSHSLVSRSLRVSASTGQPERVTVLERELEEAQTELLSLRLARAAEREASAARVESLRSTLHHNSVAVANLRPRLRGSERESGRRPWLRLGSSWRLSRRRGLESRMSLILFVHILQALVDPATGRPQDIVALRRALDASEEALTSARTSMGAMRVQISVLQGDNGVLQTELDLVHDALESNASWLNQEGFPVVTALHPDQSR
uniref:Uncharacterized protein n=1 Tax=Fagus sylvatica TaxID=28930 RepID=A0A2N9FAK0_FAGSY